MSKVLKTIQSKYSYWKAQQEKSLTRYVESGKLSDRLMAMRLTEKCKTYQEVMEVVKEEQV